MLNKLMKMLGRKNSPESSVNSAPQKNISNVKDLENFVDYVVRALVDKPESVKIETEKLENSAVIKISCAKEDMGKVIGKSGKTVMAIRSLVSGAGGRLGQRVSVEVVE